MYIYENTALVEFFCCVLYRTIIGTFYSTGKTTMLINIFETFSVGNVNMFCLIIEHFVFVSYVAVGLR